MTTTDIVVVGGGIAGSAACLVLARAGVPALWIAPLDEAFGDRIGEALAPAAGPILAALGVSQLLDASRHRRSNVTYAAWGTPHLIERNAILHLEGPGRVLDRRAFEADLRAAIVLAPSGSITRMPTKLCSAEWQGGVWTLGLDNGSTLSARFVIDASGRASVIGRRRATHRRADRLIAAYAFLRQTDDSVKPTPAMLIEAASAGWWYAALLPDGRLSVAWFSDPDLLPEDLPRAVAVWRDLLAESVHVRRWIEEAGFAIEQALRLASAGTTWLDPPAGEGWAAAGDAAAAFDPLSSHGMTTALWSGARAAEAAVAWRSGQPEKLAAYTGAVEAGVTAFLQQRVAIYRRETRFAHEPFWRRRRVLEYD